MSPKKVITDFIQDTYKIKIQSDYVVFGIRGCIPDRDGDLIDTKNEFNKYDDTLGWITESERFLVQGTVEPGKKYTVNPMNPNGAFYLKNGIYQMVRALHFGNEAFNLFSKYPQGKLEGYRDISRKGINPIIQDSKAKIFYDATGVDLHAGGNDPNNIDGWSAGCQVVLHDWNSKTWRDFKEPLYKSKQRTFLYCLFSYSDIKLQIES